MCLSVLPGGAPRERSLEHPTQCSTCCAHTGVRCMCSVLNTTSSRVWKKHPPRIYPCSVKSRAETFLENTVSTGYQSGCANNRALPLMAGEWVRLAAVLSVHGGRGGKPKKGRSGEQRSASRSFTRNLISVRKGERSRPSVPAAVRPQQAAGNPILCVWCHFLLRSGTETGACPR